ncbi:PAP fibrillin [Aureococcus anophagefferens]|nr:PAP fibrillin [Aureococcus anophagefferens]
MARVLVLALASCATAFAPRPRLGAALQPLNAAAFERWSWSGPVAPPQSKKALLQAVAAFKAATAMDGNVPIDFGVSGGELDKKSRAPRNLFPEGFDAPSLAGAAAASWRTRDSPLDGAWNNLWTTAADATFDEKTERGAARVSNVVEARRGKITNIIAFESPASKVETLKVRLSAKPVGGARLELNFRYVKVTFRKRLLGLFKSIFIPVPAAFITRVLFLFRPAKKPSVPFFDLLYLDADLRVQRTGEGNGFVQRRG